MTIEQERRAMLPEFSAALSAVREGKDVPIFEDPYLNELVDAYKVGISMRQMLICFAKWMHGFNVSDVDLDLSYMVREVAEVLEAQAQGDADHTVEELADVVIYCYGIAQMLGLDLEKVLEGKMSYNFKRNYQKEEA